MSSSKSSRSFAGGLLGFLTGGVIGFLLRPTIPAINAQLPFEAVITRGAYFKGIEQVLVPLAQTSFNYMLAGAIFGVVSGSVIGYFIKRPSREKGVNQLVFFRPIKAILLWGYARNTWQYDVLCVLILAFIFLTPKSWFATGELRSREGHQRSSASAPATPLLLSPGLISAEMSKDEVKRRVREITGRADVEVEDVRPKLNERGETVAFEVDIR